MNLVDVTSVIDSKDIRMLFFELMSIDIQTRKKVFANNRFNIYVYNEKSGNHHYKHCHLYMNEFSLIYNLEKDEILESSFKNTKIENNAIDLIVKYKSEIIKNYETVR